MLAVYRQPGTGEPMHHQPRLDAFRAICISLVFLLHWGVLDCGWIGVQAFFVLSGYLITGILRAERERAPAGSYFLNFYARRSLRIFPLYFAYLLILVALARCLGNGSDLAPSLDYVLTPNLPYLLSYTQNLHAMGGGATGPLFSHLWTLSVEEQFYLLWPLVVFLTPPKRLLQLSLVTIAAAVAIRWAALEFQLRTGLASVKTAGQFIYLFSGSHIDAFGFGALLTFRDESERLRRALPLLSRWVPVAVVAAGAWMFLLGMLARYPVGASSLGWPSHLPYFYAYIWGYTLLNALFFVVLANLDRLRLLADLRPLQRLGRVSYGFYVFHKAAIEMTRLFLDDYPGRPAWYDALCGVAAFAVAWAVSELSFRFFEGPIMRLKSRFARSADGGALATPAGAG
jgi:peptidoglycan/LPS O-acetylase OafA/YrhL